MKGSAQILMSAGVLGLCVAVVGLNAQSPSSGIDGFTSAQPEAVGMSSDRLGRIGEVFTREVETDRMPGAVVAIARHGQLVYYEAFGYLDKTAGIPMPKDAIFYAASMTKPMTSVGALILVEEGRLLLNEPVNTYLPELGTLSVIRPGATRVDDTVPAVRQPTIQDLMRHTAGFTYGNRGTGGLYERYPQSSRYSSSTFTGPQFLETLAALPLHYQPGTKWDYSLGLDVLGLAIEAVTDMPLSQFLSQRLFTPLGMVDTSFVVPPAKLARYAHALPRDPVTGAEQAYPDLSEPRTFDCGGGCTVTTARDYLRLAQMLLNGGELDGTRVLGSKTVDFMTADQLGPAVDVEQLHVAMNRPGYGFGSGVAVRRGEGLGGWLGSAGDYGWGGAGGTYFWADPEEELAVVLMAATPGPIRVHYRWLLHSLVLQAIVD